MMINHFKILLSATLSFGIISCSKEGIDLFSAKGYETADNEHSYENIEYRRLENGIWGSWTTADSCRTLIIDNIDKYNPSKDIPCTTWGGRKDIQATAIIGKEGFFRIAQYNNRYYLLDPEGGAVILHGVQHVRPGTSFIHQNALKDKFGDLLHWSINTGKLLADNNINCISYGSNRIEQIPANIKTNILSPHTKKIAYAENLYLLRTFMWDLKKNLGYTFEDDKYNRLILIFEPKFAEYIDNLIKEKSTLFSGDKSFIGYYLDNELPFASYKNKNGKLGIDLLNFLTLPDKYKEARIFAENFMKEEGISSNNDITDLIQDKFRSNVANYYYKLTTETVRRYDKEHLILGTKLHDWSKYNQSVVEACAHYCDAISINYYGRWQPEADFIDNLRVWCKTKPFFISEFYIKGDDAQIDGQNYLNTEGGGWLVHTQKDRGYFYQNFCLRLLEVSNCIGWMHFEYNDYYSEESGASNKGFVSLQYNLYDQFLYYVKQLNQEVYSLIDYYDRKILN